LQIIASILLMKARTVRSEETRLHLQDAHQRVMSVAAVQQQLQTLESETIELGPYLTRLCESQLASTHSHFFLDGVSMNRSEKKVQSLQADNGLYAIGR
jgi:two-component sensor histidine kinase